MVSGVRFSDGAHGEDRRQAVLSFFILPEVREYTEIESNTSGVFIWRSTCELRDKDVINVCDGNRLGQVADFEIDPSCGRICALIVSPDTVAGMLFSKNRIRVPWDRIVRIGKDAVLVDVRTECKRPEEACGALKGALRKKLGL